MPSWKWRTAESSGFGASPTECAEVEDARESWAKELSGNLSSLAALVKLEQLYLDVNQLTLESCRKLVSVINDGGLPALEEIGVFSDYNPASEESAGQTAVDAAISARA